MNDIACVVVTVDRSPRPNYLPTTLTNLARAGVFTSDRLHSFTLVDSAPGDWPMRAIAEAMPSLPVNGSHPVHVVTAKTRRSAKQNCAAALRHGAEMDAYWVLHLEDDLDVCGDFLGSVGRWLDRHEDSDRPVYPFSGDNTMIESMMRVGRSSWEYPVEWFWGMQCFAVPGRIAADLAEWFEEHPIYTHIDGRPDENAHDLEMHIWARLHDYAYFRGSAPSFVQHIGYETSIAGNAQGGRHVTFPSWPGPDWVYR